MPRTVCRLASVGADAFRTYVKALKKHTASGK